MTTVNLTLHSQRALTPAVGETTTGTIYVGQIGAERYDAALRFEPPADIAGATITSISLTLRARYYESTGGVLVRFGLANNTGNLASQDLDGATATSYDYLHSPTYSSPPGSSEEASESYATVELDLTSSASVANLEDDIIVLCQYDDFFDFAGGPYDADIFFDGLGGASPPTLEIVYTPVSSGVELGTGGETDTALTLSIVNPRTYTLGIASETDAGLPVTAPSVVLLGKPSSTERGLSLAIRKRVSIGIASEIDAGQSLTIKRTKLVTLGKSSEIDGGLSLSVIKDQTLAIGVARETDAALPVIATVPQSISLGVASESDSAGSVSFTFGQVVLLAIAAEADAGIALAVKVDRFVSIGTAAETDSANSVSFSISTGGFIRQFFNHLAG